jgi:hypothetical protein
MRHDCEYREALAELLEQYEQHAIPLHDRREPERYREWAQELVLRIKTLLERDV